MKIYKHEAILPLASFEKLNKLQKNNDLINIVYRKKLNRCFVKVIIFTTMSPEEILNIIGFKPD